MQSEKSAVERMDVAGVNSQNQLVEWPLTKKRHRLSKKLQKALDKDTQTYKQAKVDPFFFLLLETRECQIFSPALVLVICDACHQQMKFESHGVEFLGGRVSLNLTLCAQCVKINRGIHQLISDAVLK